MNILKKHLDKVEELAMRIFVANFAERRVDDLRYEDEAGWAIRAAETFIYEMDEYRREASKPDEDEDEDEGGHRT